VAGLGLVLAIGPIPAGLRNPVYLGLAELAPPMERLYWPVRAMVLAVPAGVVGLAWLVDRLPRRLGLAAALLLPLGLLGESLWRGQLPAATWRADVPAALACLARDDGAVIELPYGTDHDALLHQTVHERPMFGGMNERSTALVPEAQREMQAENSWMAALIRAPADPRDRSTWTEDDKAAVAALGYEWVVLRLAPMRDEHRRVGAYQRLRAARFRLQELAGPPVYSGDEVIIHAPWGATFDCPEVASTRTRATAEMAAGDERR